MCVDVCLRPIVCLCVCILYTCVHVLHVCVCVCILYTCLHVLHDFVCVCILYTCFTCVCVCVLHTSAQQGAGVKLAAQAPALSQGAAALLLGGVEAEPAAGALVCHVVVTLPDLARPGGR